MLKRIINKFKTLKVKIIYLINKLINAISIKEVSYNLKVK
jgi:hypothetical protein